MAHILKDAEVSFCNITSPEGHKNGKHMLGVFVDKKTKKDIKKQFDEMWEDNKTSKAKTPQYDMEDWFSKDEDTDKLIFWVSADVNAKYPIALKQDEGCSFKKKDFGKIGTGSIIDLEYSIYYVSNSYGEMVSRAINGVLLKKLIKYEGGSNLTGSTVEDDEPDDVPEEKPKKKKKKKKK